MASQPTSKRKRRDRNPRGNSWLVWLDILMVLAWGTVLLKYWLTDKINILLHPDYVWLAVSAGISLVILGGLKLWDWGRSLVDHKPKSPQLQSVQHFSIFPPGWGSVLLLAVALYGMTFTPRPFASNIAEQRGIASSLILTRSQPQSFRATTAPEDKSIIDWIRTLNVYPEPDAYAGQPAKVEGFVIYNADLPDNYLTIARFVITCCAADVYPVGLPVKLSQSRTAYPADQWFRVEGEMITETLDGLRQLVIQASSLTAIPEPENPYDY